MNDELQKQLADYLAAIASSAKAGSQFVIEQAPLVVQEKIAYGRVVDTCWLVFFVAATVALVWLGLKVWRMDECEPPAIVLWLVAAFVGVLSMVQLNETFQVWFAPRLYIIEWVTALIGKVSK
jgi:hypothetical protein